MTNLKRFNEWLSENIKTKEVEVPFIIIIIIVCIYSAAEAEDKQVSKKIFYIWLQVIRE